MDNAAQKQVYEHFKIFHEYAEKRKKNVSKIVAYTSDRERRPKIGNEPDAKFKMCRHCNDVFPATNEFFNKNKIKGKFYWKLG